MQTIEQAMERAEPHAVTLMETLVSGVRPGDHDILIDAPLIASAMASSSLGLSEERFVEVAREVYRHVARRTTN